MIKVATNIQRMLLKQAQDSTAANGGHGGSIGIANAPRRPTGTGLLGAPIKGPRPNLPQDFDIYHQKRPGLPVVQPGETISDSARINALRGSLTDSSMVANGGHGEVANKNSSANTSQAYRYSGYGSTHDVDWPTGGKTRTDLPFNLTMVGDQPVYSYGDTPAQSMDPEYGRNLLQTSFDAGVNPFHGMSPEEFAMYLNTYTAGQDMRTFDFRRMNLEAMRSMPPMRPPNAYPRNRSDTLPPRGPEGTVGPDGRELRWPSISSIYSHNNPHFQPPRAPTQ